MQQLTLEALELGPLLHPGLPLPFSPSGGKSSPPSSERAANIAEPEQVLMVDPLCLKQQRWVILELQCSPWMFHTIERRSQ